MAYDDDPHLTHPYVARSASANQVGEHHYITDGTVLVSYMFLVKNGTHCHMKTILVRDMFWMKNETRFIQKRVSFYTCFG